MSDFTFRLIVDAPAGVTQEEGHKGNLYSYFFSISFGYIAYTEQRENHGTMILDGACYSIIIQFCKVISSCMVEASCSRSFM